MVPGVPDLGSRGQPLCRLKMISGNTADLVRGGYSSCLRWEGNAQQMRELHPDTGNNHRRKCRCRDTDGLSGGRDDTYVNPKACTSTRGQKENELRVFHVTP